MRTPEDAVRSLARYVYEALGEPWESRLPDDDATYQRPLALTWTTAADISAGTINSPESIQPFQVVCYPEPGASPERRDTSRPRDPRRHVGRR